jgi:hypothetical protein
MRVLILASALPMIFTASTFAQQPGGFPPQVPGPQFWQQYPLPHYPGAQFEQQSSAPQLPQQLPQVQPSGQQAQQGTSSLAQVQARIRQNLQEAGFTEIQMMPTSFMVHAKNRDGNPVMMLVSPDSIQAITFEGGGEEPASTIGQGSENQQR